MTPPLRSLVPFLHVQDLDRSIAFYARFGFEVGNTFTPPDQVRPTWAWLEADGAALMLARADHPVDAAAQGAIYYLYCDDVQAMHAALAGAGIGVGAVAFPFYCPRGEFRVVDPDGYALMVTHT